MEKLRKFSFIIATLCIVGALAGKLYRPEWYKYANVAIGVGVFFFLLSLYFERHELKSFFGARSTKYGLNSVVMVILVLAIIAVVNWIVQRHPLKWDTTKNKQFSLSSLTVNTVKNLKQPVKLTAFFTESPLQGEPDAAERRVRAQDLLNNYRANSKNLEITLVDPLKNRLLTEQMGVTSNGTTVVESGKQKTTVSTLEEEDLTNAILRVTSNKETNLYFVQGHGEPSISDTDTNGYSSLADQLKKNNYNIKELKDLAATAKIPDDCNTLVVASTKVPLQDHEIKAIKDYLAAGGRVIVLDDPQGDQSVTKIYEDYKVKADDDFVIDDHQFFFLADPTVPEILPKENTPVTKEFNFRLFLPLARSFTYTQGEGGDINYTPFLESSGTSWGETDKKVAKFDEGVDKKGPLTVGLLITKSVTGDKKRSAETRLVLFGDMNFLQNAFINFGAHKEIFQNCVAWLTEQENLIHLPPKNAHNEIMAVGSNQVTLIGIAIVLVMPVIVLAAGISVWMRRKKL
ncbi:MAG: hypothetical protein C5B54_00420 [Acidobacteria bacterium]|nr:MAG: hypothetical protein C5B54_00420 [Acidobacteriota bacterium]